ncbi:MAG: cation-transporting P-type ATPase [Dehalococcoidia bacterium]|nr:MAG: cation-transporting P-type ATPase [Dehalococcoidia bacterium]
MTTARRHEVDDRHVGCPHLAPVGDVTAARYGVELADAAARSSRDVVAELASDASSGLTAAEAAARLLAVGPNEPAPIARPSWITLLLRQFTNKLILVLIGATLLSMLMGEWLNSIAIAITIVASGLFGFMNEFRSENEIAALHDLTARRAEVVRDGLHEDILASEVVPGDLIIASEGDVVAAEARVLEARGLFVMESILTGESATVPKSVEGNENASDQTVSTVLYAGTTVAAGSALAVVFATGPRTVLGGMFAAMQQTGRRATVLEKRLDVLGNRLVLVFLGLCTMFVALGLVQGREFRLLLEMAISLAVGAIPEGLPAVATASLAIAVRRLAKTRVLVRRLDAIEALGSTSVIVSDKTGTLTENRMRVRGAFLADGREFRVSVDTSDSVVATAIASPEGTPPSPADDAAVRHVLLVAALCNDAVVEHDEEQGWHLHGDPSEGAIVLAVAGLTGNGESFRAEHPRLATEPFTSATGMMRTTHSALGGGTFVAIKGAFERLAELGDRPPSASLIERVHEASDKGLRVFTVAEQAGDAAPVVLGAIVLEDPLRADAAASVEACQRAGVRLILATGDHVATARNIARDAGILRDGGTVVAGSELDLDHLDDLAVVARATYAQKEALVRALHEHGDVVAMTGDGINDASALRSADVGVAVGPGATDVAVEAADIVLADGRLLSLVDGIREGRDIIRNLRNAIVYLLTASFGTITLITLALATDRPIPLSPLQILWLNLVVHVFPALALATGGEASSHDAEPSRALLSTQQWQEIAWRSLTVGVAGLTALLINSSIGESGSHSETAVFLTLATSLVGQAFLAGLDSPRRFIRRITRLPLWGASAISVAFMLLAMYVPGMRGAMNLQAADAADWVTAGACAVGAWSAAQAGSVFIQWRAKAPAHRLAT